MKVFMIEVVSLHDEEDEGYEEEEDEEDDFDHED
jgi:hypothetical protein